MLLKPAPISTSLFHYHSGTFMADASDLGRDFRLGRVYDDACDEGITLVSNVTGCELVFALVGEKRDGEGELLYHEFKVVGHPANARRLTSSQRNLKVVIYND